jgi:hypothetical protein
MGTTNEQSPHESEHQVQTGAELARIAVEHRWSFLRTQGPGAIRRSGTFRRQ